MHSIFVKVLIWSLGTIGLSLVAYWAISRNLERRGPGDRDPFQRMNAMIEFSQSWKSTHSKPV